MLRTREERFESSRANGPGNGTGFGLSFSNGPRINRGPCAEELRELARRPPDGATFDLRDSRVEKKQRFGAFPAANDVNFLEDPSRGFGSVHAEKRVALRPEGLGQTQSGRWCANGFQKAQCRISRFGARSEGEKPQIQRSFVAGESLQKRSYGRCERDVGVKTRPKAAGFKFVEHAQGRRGQEAAGDFRENPLGNKRVDFTCVHHTAHEGERFVGHVKVGKPRRKAGCTQDANRVLFKGRTDVPKSPGFQVFKPTVRIDQPSVVVKCHGVDRQIATAEILFQRDIGGCMEYESVVARSGLALRAGERVFLVGLVPDEEGSDKW